LKEKIRHFGDKRKKTEGVDCQSGLKGFSKINK
jgi:hypothetical protein